MAEVETPLAVQFHGLNRIVSSADISAAESPDCTDCCNFGRQTGTLGPRKGRQRFSTHTYSLLGLGMLVAPFGRFKIVADTNGDWTAAAVAWAGVTPGTPTTATATAVNQDGSTKMHASAGVRFVQYGNRVIAYNGKNRPLTFDGNKWRNLGIIGGTDFLAQFTPTVTLTGGTSINVTLAALTSSVVTLTAAAHGLSAGQRITVALSNSAYDGTYTVATVPSSSTITYALTHVDIGSAAVVGTITVATTTGVAVTSVAVATNVLTVVTASAHGFVTGQVVTFESTDKVTLSGGGALLDQSVTFTIASTPTASSFTANRTWPNFTTLNIAAKSVTVKVSGTAITGITGTYYYYVVAANSTKLDLNGRMVEGLPSTISAVAAPAAQSVTIGAIPSTHIDPQVDRWNIYRTTNGGFDTTIVPEQQDFFYLGYVALGTTTYPDTTADSSNWYFSESTVNRLRFHQNIPPTFNIAALYGERVFAAGFDPISASTVTTASNATVTLASGTWPDGVKGCYFRQDGDDTIYQIKARPSTTTITLDRTFTGTTGSSKTYTIYRNPNEIWFSEFQSPDAWGKDGEFNRNKLVLPGDKAVTGLFPFQGSLLVFTATEIWAIYGKGPNRFDVKRLTDAACVDAGAVSQDSIFRSGNECHFLSLDGPASIDSVGTAINVNLYGIPLNTDWLDSLTETELKLACAGTDGRAIWYSVPSAASQTVNSKTYRFERDTKGWFEETEMCPLRFIRQDGTSGQLQQLFYLQGRFVCKSQYTSTGDLIDLVTNPLVNESVLTGGVAFNEFAVVSNVVTLNMLQYHTVSVSDSITVSATTDTQINGTYTVTAITDTTISYAKVLGDQIGTSGTIAVQSFAAHGSIKLIPAFLNPSVDLEECWIRFYTAAGALFTSRRITSSSYNVTSGVYTLTWSTGSTLPGAGNVTVAKTFTYEIGNIGWKWLTKTNVYQAHRQNAEEVHVEFVQSASATILHTDVIDDVEGTNSATISCANKVAYKYDVNGSNRNYATRLASRTSAVISGVTLVASVEAGTN